MNTPGCLRIPGADDLSRREKSDYPLTNLSNPPKNAVIMNATNEIADVIIMAKPILTLANLQTKIPETRSASILATISRMVFI